MAALTDPDLVQAARFELAAREKHWPEMVAAGEMEADQATADIAAWAAIVALLGETEAETDWRWPDLVAAVQRAIDRRAAKPASAATDARIGALAAIRRTLIDAAHAAGAFAWAPPSDAEGRPDLQPQQQKAA